MQNSKKRNNSSLAAPKSIPTRRKSQIVSAKFSGPIPPPDLLIKYEDATHGAASRIIAMAERQAKHRQNLETAIIHSSIRNEKTGMWLAFILTLVLVLIGAILIMNSKDVIGYITLFAPVLFQAGNYVYWRYEENKKEKTDSKEASK
jgi:uncharacterized membrane protein